MFSKFPESEAPAFLAPRFLAHKKGNQNNGTKTPAPRPSQTVTFP